VGRVRNLKRKRKRAHVYLFAVKSDAVGYPYECHVTRYLWGHWFLSACLTGTSAITLRLASGRKTSPAQGPLLCPPHHPRLQLRWAPSRGNSCGLSCAPYLSRFTSSPPTLCCRSRCGCSQAALSVWSLFLLLLKLACRKWGTITLARTRLDQCVCTDASHLLPLSHTFPALTFRLNLF